MEIRNEPWLTEDAISLLKFILPKHKALNIFEFGTGASTLWFSKLNNLNLLFSVDDNINWHTEIKNRIINDKCLLYLQERPYNNIIERFENDLFDIILVDGRDRVKCIKSSISKLKSNGVLLLDNSEREEYKEGIELMKDWIAINTYQPLPDKYDFTYPNWKTTFYIKP